VNPTFANNIKSFTWQWVDTYNSGGFQKYGGLKYPKEFQDKTKGWILRRTRDEVMPELPKVNRMMHYVDLGNVEEAYKETWMKFKDYHDNNEDDAFTRATNEMSMLARMRHLTGLAKVDPCVEFLQDFIEETDRKIVVFLHHKKVAALLKNRLPNALELNAGLTPVQRAEVLGRFRDNGNRVMLASTLSSGEGLNMQFCADGIMLERQWNPANEEQAECRFIRIGQMAQNVNMWYFLAGGTVDEILTNLVETKRRFIGQSLNKDYVWDEHNLMVELRETLAEQGGKRWGL
jgi:SNF2 family DNA or RNA helicase